MYSSFKNISKWSHLRLSSTDSKVIITFYSIMNITVGKYCLVKWSDQTASFTDVKDDSQVACFEKLTL